MGPVKQRGGGSIVGRILLLIFWIMAYLFLDGIGKALRGQ
jgi:hypothetical protein